MADNTQSSGLFSVFVLSIFTLVLLPYTIYHFCAGAEDDVVQPWQPGGRGASVHAHSTQHAHTVLY